MDTFDLVVYIAGLVCIGILIGFGIFAAIDEVSYRKKYK